jgi:long-subunit acyl-CoA synthetase (AMP-forming)
MFCFYFLYFENLFILDNFIIFIGIYVKHPSIQQIFIYGNSLQSTLVAVVIPVDAAFEAIKKDKNVLMKEINAHAKANDALKGFEMIRGIHIETELFSVTYIKYLLKISYMPNTFRHPQPKLFFFLEITLINLVISQTKKSFVLFFF